MRPKVETYLTQAGITFAAFVIVGAIVAHASPGPVDRSELGSYGVAVALASFLTGAGRFPVYVVLCVAVLIFGRVRRAWLGRGFLSVFGLIVVWRTSDLAKALFHRPRPPHPILAETSFGYPSGHADLAIFFYGLWASYVWESRLAMPLRATLVALLLVWIAAIGWSRLALGAHYPTDVAGGYLFGAAWLAVARAVVALRHKSHGAPASEILEANVFDG